MKKKRLFLVSGTLQAFIVLAIIKDGGNMEVYEDFAYITNTAVNPNANQQIVKTIEDILGIHPFKQIGNLTSKDEAIAKLYQEDRFLECETFIKAALDMDFVDELYMVDNSKNITMKMAGRAFDDAYIVNYADGLGFIRSSLGYGFCHLNEIRTFVPINFSKGFTSALPLNILDKALFFEAVDSYYAENEAFKNAIDRLKETVTKSSVLLTTQQFAEWQMMTFDNEINMYVKAIERQCGKDDTIVIKDHPRETIFGRRERLMSELEAKGYGVIHMDDEALRLMPIEAICRFITFKKAVCTSSTSGINLKFFYDMDCDISVDKEDFKNYKKGIYFELYMAGLQKALENVDAWDVKSPLFEYERPPLNYQYTAKSLLYISNERLYQNLFSNYYLQGRRIADFFREKGFKSIGVYGLGQIGKQIGEDLLKEDSLDVCFIDRSLAGKEFMGKPINLLEKLDSVPDAIIITLTHSLEETENLIKKNTPCRKIYSLLDL